MTEFETALRCRIDDAESAGSAADTAGDDFGAAVFRADAHELRLLADAHGLRLANAD
jgi:hypothetical protein